MTDYRSIVDHYEQCLARHGDCHLGVDWPNAADAERRYRVMLDVVRAGDIRPVTLLDFGCGASHLHDYILRNSPTAFVYSGLDLSTRFIELSRQKHPTIQFYECDVLNHSCDLPVFDYVVMNGVFTEKRGLSYDAMLGHFKQMIHKVFALSRRGMAFNVMSKHVDWERDDLFHLSYDVLAAFLKKEISRHFIFRADYGLYEFTSYVYREAE